VVSVHIAELSCLRLAPTASLLLSFVNEESSSRYGKLAYNKNCLLAKVEKDFRYKNMTPTSPLHVLIGALLLSSGCSLLTGARSPRVTSFPSTSNPAFAHNDNGVHRRQRTVHMVLSPPKDKNKKVVKVSGASGEPGDSHDVKEREQPLANGKQKHDYDDETVAGPAKLAAELTQGVRNATEDQVQQNIQAAEDVMELMTEISERMSNGSKEMLGDLSGVMEEKLVRLPDDAASEFAGYLTELTETIQNAQQRELERQLAEFEARFVKPLEQFVFSDAAIYGGKSSLSEERKALRSKLVWAGANSTLSASRRLRTKEMIKNINVAPFYYSVALLMRWVRKVGYPPMLLLTALRSMASVVKTPNIRRSYRKGDQYQEYLKDAEMMQAGWKRTGEIASKGPMARKWAILRRSAEIWAYFSSFYIKEKRFVSKFNKGKWSSEKLSEERVKLGKEITQNLLKLGPTFIKVSLLCSDCVVVLR
jgi:hypothetical protein